MSHKAYVMLLTAAVVFGLAGCVLSAEPLWWSCLGAAGLALLMLDVAEYG